MKLHRLVLTDYRGISHRDIVFPDRGVVVISGPNEIGKSSMIEALDLLFTVKDRSNKREVKQVKPTHADAGADVTAEISTGEHRFVYRKRFHKQALTELTVLAPRREQLTGDEAHERVLTILSETVDMDLWRAQRILQATSTAPVDLSGSDALSRALDVAAGQAVAPSGTEPVLVDQIDAEYRQYFTATGKPTGDWATATKQLLLADQQVARCTADLAEVDAAVAEHAELTGQLAGVTLELDAAAQHVETAQLAAAEVATLAERAERAGALADAVESARVAAVAAVAQRGALRDQVQARAVQIAELEASARHAVAEQTEARTAAVAAAEAARVARGATEQTEALAQAARVAVDAVARRDEARRLADRIAKVDATLTQLRRCEADLAGITVSAKAMKAIDTAEAAVERAVLKAEMVSARIEVTAVSDVDVVIGGTAIGLGAGTTHAIDAGAGTDVELPGVLTVRVVAAEAAVDSQAVLDAAREHLAGLLAGARVADVATARREDERRRQLTAQRDTLQANCDGLLGGEDLDEQRARLATLSAEVPPDCTDDAVVARDALGTARAAHRDALACADAMRIAAERAAADAAAQDTAATVLAEKVTTAGAQLAAAADALAVQRESVPDDRLVADSDAAARRAGEASAQAHALATELAELAPATVAAELTQATLLATTLSDRHDDMTDRLRDLSAHLKVYGSEGRQGRLDAAEADREHAHAEFVRLRRRAGAAELLRSVIVRHRDAARQRYVDPFRTEVKRLGRIVFGADFDVEIDADLRILSRTRAGVTVDYESLSGGAQEQLGIVTRLASASLVAKEDGVPVIIDDALGFTDADRLTRMGEVFDAVGGDGQVIVLTCSPQRYASIIDAHRIELTV